MESATLGVFLMPWVLAAAAVVGLLGVTALNLARHAVISWPYAVIVVVALVLALRTKVHPTLILLGGAAAGAGLGALMGARIP